MSQVATIESLRRCCYHEYNQMAVKKPRMAQVVEDNEVVSAAVIRCHREGNINPDGTIKEGVSCKNLAKWCISDVYRINANLTRTGSGHTYVSRVHNVEDETTLYNRKSDDTTREVDDADELNHQRRWLKGEMQIMDKRDQSILQLTMDGLTNPEIAVRLGGTETEIGNRKHQLYRTLKRRAGTIER